MRNIYIFFFITLNIYANTPLDIVNKQIQDLEQKRVFEEQKANKAKKMKSFLIKI